MIPFQFRSFRLSLLLFLLLLAASGSARSGKQYIYLDSPVYEYIEYAINTGDSRPGFVLQQPYDLTDSLLLNPGDRFGYYFQNYWRRFYRAGKAVLSLDARGQAKLDGALVNRSGVELGVHYVNDHITLANRTSGLIDYKYDPKFAGDLSESKNWIYGRVNEAYLNLNFGRFSAFIGRMKRNWGPPGAPGLILSDNPYTYDHLLLAYSGRAWRFSLFYSRLEDINALQRSEPEEEPRYIENARRHWAGHRLDFRISDKLQFALTEMAMYGGPGRDFELAFFNPMNLYYPSQRNDRLQISGIWAVDVFYKPWRKTSFYGQFLVDDIIVNNDPGVDDRGRYPDRLGIQLSLRQADLPLKGLNTNFTYVRIWNRTYQSKSTWENYHFRGYGLAYPCASCEEVKLKWSFWAFFPVWISNETIYGRYGDVELTDLFPLRKEPFPVPPVQNNLVNILKMGYMYSQNLRLNTSLVWRENANHYTNRFGDRSHWVFRLSLRYILDGAVNLD